MKGRGVGRVARRVGGTVVLARDFALAVLAVVAVLPLWCLPWRAAATLGRWYGRVAFLCWPLGRRAGMINLRRADPSMTRAGARTVTRAVFESLAQGIAEGLQFGRRYKDGRDGWDRCYQVEDPALEARILGDPRPKIFVTGHLGSWEIAAMVVGIRMGRRGAVIVRRVDNPFLDAVVRFARLRHPSQRIDKRGAVDEALTRLRRGDSVALLADENAGPRGVFTDFFGRPASTVKTPALLALLTGAPIVLGAVVRRRDGSLLYRLAVIEPPAGGGAQAVHALTQQYTEVWEHWVRQAPDQWRWIHWRWKHRPDGTEETYTRRDVRACFSQGRGPAVPDDRRTRDAIT
jgi:KDO2-lipid IV(A) lauroyltransferase